MNATIVGSVISYTMIADSSTVPGSYIIDCEICDPANECTI